MKKIRPVFQLILILFLILSCKNQIPEKENTKVDLSKKTARIITPESFNIIEELEGDLDKDGVSEKIIVYNTKKQTDFGTERQLYIYKKNNNRWKLWKKSATTILASEHGGMMGDPFKGINIEKNCIVIKHFGGSRQKWNYTHRFRYQNGNFQLIGATVIYGTPCDYFETFDYNLSNGKINYEIETEDCESKSTKIKNKEMIRKLEVLPTMDGFLPGSNELTFPESEITIYY